MDKSYSVLNKFITDWGREVRDHEFLIFLSLILIVFAAIMNYAAGFYVTNKAEVADVPDLILKYFGPVDLNFLFVYGLLLIFSILIIYPLLFKVNKLHYVLAQFSFLTILRSFFIILTHLRTPISSVGGKFPGILNVLKFTNDQFFSGHVAVPFLGFLIFKDNTKLRYFFLIASIVMAVTVLLMHQHYSIDVFAAYFITYGCYKIGNWLLNKLKL